MTTLLWALVWQTAAVAAVAAVGDWFLRCQPAARRHVVMVTALLLAAVLPFATVGLRVHTHWLKPPSSTLNAVVTPSLTVLASTAPSPVPAASPVSQISQSEVPAPAIRPAARSWARQATPWLMGALCLFAALWHLAAFVQRWRRTRRLCRSASPNRIVAGIPVLRSAEPGSPFTAGVFRPLIVLPEALLQSDDPRWLDAALTHELAHVQRRDYAWALLCELAMTPLAFHPAARWMLRRIAETREMACDEVAVGIVPGYAGALVAIAGHIAAGLPLAGLCLARRTSFERRIRALAVTPSRRSAATLAASLGALAIASVSAWALGGGLRAAAPRPHGMSFVASPPQQSQNPVLPPAPAKTQQQQAALAQELSAMENKWLNEDVVYIITPEERGNFLKLSSSEERKEFIEQFWQRRNPDPGSTYNKFEEEQYRRLAYDNEHFSTPTLPGWKSDRGRIYITWGPPNNIEDHDGGANPPYEDWIYNELPGIGANIKLEFVDKCGCGVFSYVAPTAEMPPLLLMPNEGLARYDDLMAGQTSRFTRADGTSLPVGAYQTPRMSPLVFGVRVDYIKDRVNSVLVPITVQLNADSLTYEEAADVRRASVHIFGRISTLAGKQVAMIQQPVSFDVSDTPSNTIAGKTARYCNTMPLAPGTYKVDLTVRDVNQPNNLDTKALAIHVPLYKDGVLASSSVVLADQLTPAPPDQPDSGQFIVGDTQVWAVVGNPPPFRTGQFLYVWAQIYNVHPGAAITYTVTEMATRAAVLKIQDASNSNLADGQLTLSKQLPLTNMKPGNYKLEVQVDDSRTGQSVAPSAVFSIVPRQA